LKATIKWLDGVSFNGSSESGHSLTMDGPQESGGKNNGMRPMELLLVGLGGCTSYDVITILKKSRQDVKDCRAEISAERSENIPKVFTKIHIHFVLEGHNLDESVVHRAINLSATKYCSASIMLEKSVIITHDFEILVSS
jgi:putative redox protein|tara:strand:+ start:490 stop:909 length:420 start_codon:yes stop_codon:yes gene_type:complete